MILFPLYCIRYSSSNNKTVILQCILCYLTIYGKDIQQTQQYCMYNIVQQTNTTIMTSQCLATITTVQYYSTTTDTTAVLLLQLLLLCNIIIINVHSHIDIKDECMTQYHPFTPIHKHKQYPIATTTTIIIVVIVITTVTWIFLYIYARTQSIQKNMKEGRKEVTAKAAVHQQPHPQYATVQYHHYHSLTVRLSQIFIFILIFSLY